MSKERLVQIVVDASALLAVLLDEAHRDEVVTVTAGATLCAPASLPWEMGNALSAGLKRHRFSLDVAHAAVGAFEKIPIRLVPVDITIALELAHRHRLYAYDAYLLATCAAVRAPLLTLDQNLRKAATATRIPVIEV
jgi:predicted nucleic acid-binding protein